MDLDVVKKIERLAPTGPSSERKRYYEELRKKCASAPGAYEAILNTILQCKVLTTVSYEQRRNFSGKKLNSREEYERFKKNKEQFMKLFDKLVEKIDGTLTFRPEPAEWPRDHMGIRKGSAETLVNQRGEMVGIRPGSFEREVPKGGRPKNSYMDIVLLMLDSKLREYRIRPRYGIIGEIFYYFFDVERKRDSSYDADTIKRIIIRLRHNKDLVARVEATLRKAREIQSGPHRLRTAFPREDSISF
jgi:hypothetical protein